MEEKDQDDAAYQSWAGTPGMISSTRELMIGGQGGVKRQKQTLSVLWEWGPPPTLLIPGQKVQMLLKVTVKINSHPSWGQSWLGYGMIYVGDGISGTGAFYNKDGKFTVGYGNLANGPRDTVFGNKGTMALDGEATMAGVESGFVREEKGKKLIPITVTLVDGGDKRKFYYLYVWQPSAPPGPQSDIAGVWKYGDGGTTLTITPKGDGTYKVVQKGLGNAVGTAKRTAKGFTIDYASPSGGVTGRCEVTLDPGNRSGTANWQDSTGGKGTVQVSLVQPAVATPPTPPPGEWTVTADGYPDISGDWLEASAHTVKTVQSPGGKVTATCTYTLGGKTLRWTTTGTLSKTGHFTGVLQHTEGVPTTGLGYRQDRAMQLSADGLTFSGKASFPGGGHAVKWTRKGLVDGPPPPPPPPAGMTLQAGTLKAKTGENVTVAVWLLKGAGLIDLNLDLEYDAAVVQAVGNVVRGNLLDGAEFQANTAKAGVVKIGLVPKTGGIVGAKGTVAQIAFKAIGQPGSRTALRLVPRKASAAGGAPARIATIDGEIQIVNEGGFLPGDVSGNGSVGMDDVMMTLKMSVDLLPKNARADMDKDGDVTAADARLIREIVLGIKG